MKVAFVGAGGTGKTTLTNETYNVLRRTEYDVGKIEEVARIVFHQIADEYRVCSLDEIRSDFELFIEFEKRIIEEQYKYEKHAEKYYDIVLSDRSTYDPLVYTLYFYGMEGLYELQESLHRKYLTNSYDKMFLVFPFTTDPEILDDGFRTPDVDRIEEIHNLFRICLGRMCDYVAVRQLDDRVAYVVYKMLCEGLDEENRTDIERCSYAAELLSRRRK